MYRPSEQTNAGAVSGLTPGAGPSCQPGRRVPSKRMRAWHRNLEIGTSLKSYARRLATTSGDNKATAMQWLAGKGVRP